MKKLPLFKTLTAFYKQTTYLKVANSQMGFSMKSYFVRALVSFNLFLKMDKN